MSRRGVEQVETTQLRKTEESSIVRGDEILACLATNPEADKKASVTLLARLRRGGEDAFEQGGHGWIFILTSPW